MRRRVKPKAIDLFCGAGGMSLGFEEAGFNVIGAIDIEQNNKEIYSKNFPDCNVWCADLSTLSGKEIMQETGLLGEPVDVLFGGPPCQGFSLIGRRVPHDPRNALLHDFARLVIELSPRYFVVENVNGILLGDAKKSLDRFVAIVEEAGYDLVKPIQLLDAAEFGVPQRRRRVFLLGYLAGSTAPEYPKPISRVDRPTVWDAIGDLPKISEHDYLFCADEYFGSLGRRPSAYAKILRGEVRDPQNKSAMHRTNCNGLGGCLRTLHTSETVKRFKSTKQGQTETVSRFYRLAKNGVAPTLRAGTGADQGSFMAPRPIHPFQHRCITVREGARLQSFPDWFRFHPTKWHGFRQVGNSVPPRLARAVARSVWRALEIESSVEGTNDE
jgi:DNA (cytosine-5)-methyltransferase 1